MGNLKQKVLKKLEEIENLPTLPVVFARITRAIEDPDSTAQDIAKLMEDDPAMVMRVLRLVNSSMYSFSGASKIVSVQQAVVRLGFRAVKNVALSATVFDVFKEPSEQAMDRPQFWRHCIYCGIVANAINRNKPNIFNITQEDVTVAALLHDIGKIIFEQYFHEIFKKITDFARIKHSLTFDAEARIFQIDHAAVGAWLAKKWGLPPEIRYTIAFHHSPYKAPEQYRPLVALVNVADYICNLDRLGSSGNGAVPAYHLDAWQMFDLTEEDLPILRKLTEEEAKKSQIMLSLY